MFFKSCIKVKLTCHKIISKNEFIVLNWFRIFFYIFCVFFLLVVSTACVFTTNTIVYNITTLQERVDDLKKNLTIDTRNTSSYRRSLTCASDPRPSAAHVGYLGICILSVTGGLLLCADLSRLAKSDENEHYYGY